LSIFLSKNSLYLLIVGHVLLPSLGVIISLRESSAEWQVVGESPVLLSE